MRNAEHLKEYQRKIASGEIDRLKKVENEPARSELIDCTFEQTIHGTAIIRDGDVIFYTKKFTPDELRMINRQTEIYLCIQTRLVETKEAKILNLIPGDRVYWTDGDYGAHTTVKEDKGTYVIMEELNACGDHYKIPKHRMRYRDFKCYQTKQWV